MQTSGSDLTSIEFYINVWQTQTAYSYSTMPNNYLLCLLLIIDVIIYWTLPSQSYCCCCLFIKAISQSRPSITMILPCQHLTLKCGEMTATHALEWHIALLNAMWNGNLFYFHSLMHFRIKLNINEEKNKKCGIKPNSRTTREADAMLKAKFCITSFLSFTVIHQKGVLGT